MDEPRSIARIREEIKAERSLLEGSLEALGTESRTLARRGSIALAATLGALGLGRLARARRRR